MLQGKLAEITVRLFARSIDMLMKQTDSLIGGQGPANLACSYLITCAHGQTPKVKPERSARTLGNTIPRCSWRCAFQMSGGMRHQFTCDYCPRLRINIEETVHLAGRNRFRNAVLSSEVANGCSHDF